MHGRAQGHRRRNRAARLILINPGTGVAWLNRYWR